MKTVSSLACLMALAVPAIAVADGHVVSDDVIAEQRAALASATDGAGYGPQSPRDLETVTGENNRIFNTAPAYTEMNLCNIHFHEGAEHRGGDYTTYLGNGDGTGYGTGFGYDGSLTEAELAPYEGTVGGFDKGNLEPGDTIEVHYVHTTAQITPGPTLGSCLSEAIVNPQLRVEGQVFVIVNDEAAADFMELTEIGLVNGYHQALNIPATSGDPITYPGSTTGPSYNRKASPIQVSWSMRPGVIKVDIRSVEAWLADNQFDEKYAHGVRNLVVNPALVSNLD